MRIGFFGEGMREHQADIRSDVALGYGFGGDTLNTALYLQRIGRQTGADVVVQYFTMLGQDEASDQLAATLAAEGLSLRAARHPDKTLGQYWIDIDAAGERSFRYQREDSAARQYFSSATTDLEQALSDGSLDVLYLSGISLAILAEQHRMRLYSALAGFVRRGGRLIYDNNFRPLLWPATTASRWQQLLLPLCALAFLTDSDERLIWQKPSAGAASLVDAALRAGVGTVVLKCGPAPCWIGQGVSRLQVAAQQVAFVVDSSGAGDAFAAGFLARFLPEPAALAAAAGAGHQLAAAVVQQHGAMIAPALMPFLSQQTEGSDAV